MFKYKIRYFLFRVFRKIIVLIYLLKGDKITYDNSKIKVLNLIAYFKRYYIYNNNNIKLKYVINNDIGFMLYFFGKFEENELLIISKFILNDSIIIDIGANIGIHSMLFSKLAPNGTIYSFEPSRGTFEILNKNLIFNNNVIPLNFGIGNSTELMEFYEAEDNAFSSFKDTKRKQIIKLSKVLCIKIDEFINLFKINRIDFIKIDVEGFEQEVIEGMTNVLKNIRPVIFCEIYQGINSNMNPLSTINTIKNYNYDAYVIKQNELLIFEEHSDNYPNYIFLPK